MTPADPRPRPSTVSPWERWAWVFAGIWLVFLVYPVIETFQATDSVVVTALGLALIAAFAVVYLAGYGWLADRPWLVFGLLVALALATATIIGVEAIGLTPYLGVYSALMLPSPWWPRTTLVVALLPLLSLVAGDGFPAFFFLMVWPIIIGMVLLRVFTEGEHRADESRAELALRRRARAGGPRRPRRARPLAHRAEHQGRAGRRGSSTSTPSGPAPSSCRSRRRRARRWPRSAPPSAGCGPATSTPSWTRHRGCWPTPGVAHPSCIGDVADTDPRHRTLLAWVLREAVTNVVRHAGASSVVVELGPRGITVTDDGAGDRRAPGGQRAARHARAGLRRRRHPGRAATPDPGTRVQVVLP